MLDRTGLSATLTMAPALAAADCNHSEDKAGSAVLRYLAASKSITTSSRNISLVLVGSVLLSCKMHKLRNSIKNVDYK